MTYFNPLHFLSEKKDNSISSSDLSDLETKLRHLTTNRTSGTIIFNSQSYELKEIMAALQWINLPLGVHRIINQNPLLNDFLTHGSLIFFEDRKNFEVFNDSEIKDRLQLVFTTQLAKNLETIIEDQSFKSINQARIITKNADLLPKSYESAAYQHAYQVLNQKIIHGTATLKDPFQTGDSPQLKKEAISFFDLHYLELFRALPPYFKELPHHYAAAAHNYLVRVLNRHNDPSKVSKPVARVLYNAAKIDATIRKDPNSAQLVKTFDKVIQKKGVVTKEYTGHKLRSVWVKGGVVIFFLLFFAFIGNRAGGCYKKSDYQKANDRYNAAVRREQSKREKINNKVPINPADMLGKWQDDLFIDKVRVIRTLDLYTTDIGKSTFQLVTTTGDPIAEISGFIRWIPLANKSNPLEDFLEYDHQTPLDVAVYSTMSEKEEGVFNRIADQMRYEHWKQLLILDADDDEMKLAGKEYSREEYYETSAFPIEVKEKIAAIRIQDQQYVDAINNFYQQYEQDSLSEISILVQQAFDKKTMEVKMSNHRQYETAAEIFYVDGVPHLNPLKWTNGRGYYKLGTFKDVNYLKRDVRKTGNIELFYNSYRSYRFREEEKKD